MEFPNARAALQWAIEKREDTVGFRLAFAFGKFWFSHGHMREAEMWFERMLALDRQTDKQDIPQELHFCKAKSLTTPCRMRVYESDRLYTSDRSSPQFVSRTYSVTCAS